MNIKSRLLNYFSDIKPLNKRQYYSIKSQCHKIRYLHESNVEAMASGININNNSAYYVKREAFTAHEITENF